MNPALQRIITEKKKYKDRNDALEKARRCRVLSDLQRRSNSSSAQTISQNRSRRYSITTLYWGPCEGKKGGFMAQDRA
jgi:hypothetical protein